MNRLKELRPYGSEPMLEQLVDLWGAYETHIRISNEAIKKEWDEKYKDVFAERERRAARPIWKQMFLGNYDGIIIAPPFFKKSSLEGFLSWLSEEDIKGGTGGSGIVRVKVKGKK